MIKKKNNDYRTGFWQFYNHCFFFKSLFFWSVTRSHSFSFAPLIPALVWLAPHNTVGQHPKQHKKWQRQHHHVANQPTGYWWRWWLFFDCLFISLILVMIHTKLQLQFSILQKILRTITNGTAYMRQQSTTPTRQQTFTTVMDSTTDALFRQKFQMSKQ